MTAGNEALPACRASLQRASWSTSSPPKACRGRRNPTGPWPPLELRTPTALTVGQSYLHPATGTRVRVQSATAGGFRVEIASKAVSVPGVVHLPRAAAEDRILGPWAFGRWSRNG